ncbi:MAG: hypothetical protein RLZZ142_2229, partial [Verrucomicrobiota bacterium]
SLQWELRDNTLLAFPLQIDAAPFALRLEGSLHLKDLSLQLQAKLSSSLPLVPGTEAPREADSVRFKARGSLLKPLWQKD